MTLRRFSLTVATGLLCAVLGMLAFRRRAADAQRRQGVLSNSEFSLSSASRVHEDPAVSAAVARAIRPLPIESVINDFDPSRARREPTRYVVDLTRERHAVLTLDPSWQRAITDLLTTYAMPRASVVVIDTDTGRVRAYVSRGEPGAGDLARDATPPAASVFKIVTASLLVQRGVPETTMTCYSGGFHAVRERDLVADPRRDHDCISLAEAFGRSANTVFARHANERLSPADLLGAAHAWGFGEAIPFDAAVPVEAIDVPAPGIEFARAAAGFWHSHMSPLHGALIAQAVARGGELQRPFIIEGIYDGHGGQLATGAPHAWRRAVSPEVATAISHMMVHSVSDGTAYHAFHDNAGRAFLPGIEVGGKTGTLTGDNPFRAYTWFIGNASNSAQHVSFAVMVANGPVWRVRASTLARQVLQIVYHGRATN